MVGKEIQVNLLSFHDVFNCESICIGAPGPAGGEIVTYVATYL